MKLACPSGHEHYFDELQSYGSEMTGTTWRCPTCKGAVVEERGEHHRQYRRDLGRGHQYVYRGRLIDVREYGQRGNGPAAPPREARQAPRGFLKRLFSRGPNAGADNQPASLVASKRGADETLEQLEAVATGGGHGSEDAAKKLVIAMVRKIQHHADPSVRHLVAADNTPVVATVNRWLGQISDQEFLEAFVKSDTRTLGPSYPAPHECLLVAINRIDDPARLKRICEHLGHLDFSVGGPLDAAFARITDEGMVAEVAMFLDAADYGARQASSRFRMQAVKRITDADIKRRLQHSIIKGRERTRPLPN